MTGFGRGQVNEFGYCVTAEVRSVNTRYTEINVRLPRTMANLEAHVAEVVQQRISRGKVSVAVTLEAAEGRASAGLQEVLPDLELARGYQRALETLRDHLGLSDPVDLHALLRLNDIIVVREAELDEALATRLLDECLRVALDELDAMRVREGRALAADFLERLSSLSRLLADILARAPARVEEARQKLTEHIATLLETDVVDEQRLAMEVAIIADRSDVTEECVRLQSHLDQFKKLMDEDSAGRKLNFLLQEVNREVNTIGSKSNDATIAHLVVQMKDETERLREQVQNIE